MSDQGNRYPLPLAPAAIDALVPCSRGAGCPLGVDVPAMANAILDGDHQRAYLIARGPNPFASSCGHGCHAPCETACRRKRSGAPVAIAALEGYAAAFSTPTLVASPGPCASAHDARSVAALAGERVENAPRAPRSGCRVAIIGGGPAALACAHDLTLLGHSCTIFDAAAEPGGLLTGGIPAFRFPVAAARAECAAILSLGVEYRGGTPVAGPDALRALLREGFHAVFLAIGASAPRAPIVGRDPGPPAIVDAMALLAGSNSPAAPPGRIVVVGEGDLATDAARTVARRWRDRGVGPLELVHLVLTSPVEHSPVSPAMLGAALRDGVTVHDGWRARHVATNDAGAITGVEVTREGGRRAMMIPCDSLVLAAPRAPAAAPLDEALALDADGFVAVDPDTLRTSIPGVWAGGACAFGHRSIAHAAADGKRAAWGIHAALTGVRVARTVFAAWIEVDDRSASRTARALRTTRLDAPLSAPPPADAFSAAGLDESRDPAREAARCLDCTVLPVVDDSCTSCGACVETCPTDAFSFSEGPPRTLHLDQDACTRCGKCVQRCPVGAIAMVRGIWEERLSVAD